MKRKAEIVIGHRAAAFMRKYALDNNLSLDRAMRRIGMARKIIYEWERGAAPSAFALQGIAFLGGDINAMLTKEV